MLAGVENWPGRMRRAVQSAGPQLNYIFPISHIWKRVGEGCQLSPCPGARAAPLSFNNDMVEDVGQLGANSTLMQQVWAPIWMDIVGLVNLMCLGLRQVPQHLFFNSWSRLNEDSKPVGIQGNGQGPNVSLLAAWGGQGAEAEARAGAKAGDRAEKPSKSVACGEKPDGTPLRPVDVFEGVSGFQTFEFGPLM